MFKRIASAIVAFFAFASVANADISDGQFSTNQIFDVQYYWSGNTLNASSFIAPYDMNFQHPTVNAGDYFKFFPSTTNPGTYGLGLYDSTGALKQVVHNTGTLQAIGPDALFYIGSGFFGTVITTSAGYAYGQSGTFTNMDTSVSTTDASSYTWASTTPLAAGQTASTTTTTTTTTPTVNLVSVNSSVVNVYPTSNNSPAGETAAKALDSTSSTKYLNFDRANAGFTIKLPAGKVVSALTFTTANDFVPRDPTKFTLQGSNDGVNWTAITTDQAITLSDSRYTTSAQVSVNNTTPYVYYFITFTSIKAIDQYGSVAGCQAALGTLACDSVQIGDVNFLTDSNNTATSTDQAVAGSRVQNPGAPAPVVTNGTPTVTSTSTQGAATTTSTTSRGVTTTTDVVTRGNTVTTTSFADHASRNSKTIDVTRTTTTVRTTPVYTSRTWTTPVTTTVVTRIPTITTTTTIPQIVTTYSDGSTSVADGTSVIETTTTYVDTPVSTVTDEVINAQIVSSDVQTAQSNRTASASSVGLNDAIKIARNNPFLIDPLEPRDANWIAPRAAYYSVSSGKYMQGGISFGRQETVENNTFGVAFDASTTDSHGMLNSQNNSESYSGTAYILSRQDYVWVKGAIGASSNKVNGTTKIPEFILSNSQKATQNLVYGDATVYSAETFGGFRPFLGAKVISSQVNYASSGSAIIAPNMPKKSTTEVQPYGGVRWEYDPNTGLEMRVTKTRDFKTVAGVRGYVIREITDGVAVSFTVGADKGSHYSNVYGMVGLVIKF